MNVLKLPIVIFLSSLYVPVRMSREVQKKKNKKKQKKKREVPKQCVKIIKFPALHVETQTGEIR